MRTVCLGILKGIVLLTAVALPLYAEDTGTEKEVPVETDTQSLAKKLQNPMAKLISVPLQNNFEYKLGPKGKGYRYTLRFQPVIPMTLNDNWNLVLRPIIPFIHQSEVITNTEQEGLGDIELEPIFSHRKPGIGGFNWGVGPVLLFPTAASEHLGSQKWGIGPHGVLIKQTGPWTRFILANHLWSYAGNDKREDISETYLQPVLAHSSKKGFTIAASSETTYDWKDRQWTIPLIGTVSQIFPLSGRYASIGIGGIYYLEAPRGGPQWGIRLTLTFVFPKGPQQSEKVK